MKNKLVSFLIWALLGTIWMYGYFTFTWNDTENISIKNWPTQSSWDISDEQLQRMEDRSGLSKEVIQERLDAWENMRDIMGWAWKWNK